MLKSEGLPVIFPFYQNDGMPLHEYNEAKELLGIQDGGPHIWPCPLIFPPNQIRRTSHILQSEYILKVSHGLGS